MRNNTSIKADSAEKLVKISTVIKEIYGDDLHKKRQPFDFYGFCILCLDCSKRIINYNKDDCMKKLLVLIATSALCSSVFAAPTAAMGLHHHNSKSGTSAKKMVVLKSQKNKNSTNQNVKKAKVVESKKNEVQ